MGAICYQIATKTSCYQLLPNSNLGLGTAGPDRGGSALSMIPRRIMTTHKSKRGIPHGAWVGSRIGTFLENWKKNSEFFFAGVSRAKQQLCLTVTKYGERPHGYHRCWDEALM